MNLESCNAPLWAPTGHLQTLGGYFLRSPLFRGPTERKEILLPDGDRLVARLFRGTEKKLVYLFHGLTGSAESNYIQRTARICEKRGLSCLLVNHRGCGEGAGLASRPYHSGCMDDLSEVIRWGRTQFKNHKQLAVGFSLSGNALLRLLVERGARTLPDVALSVNPPVDLDDCSRQLCLLQNKLYDMKFIQGCKKEIDERIKVDPNVALFDLSGVRNLRDFDEVYTGPAAGFANRKEYYDVCSTWRRLGEIVTPTTILTAADDPFISVDRFLEAKPSTKVGLMIEKSGGHLGYLSRSTPFGSRRWLDYAIDHWLSIE